MFRLLPDADVQAFIDADDRVQMEFFYQQRGLVRRTTGRGPDGWIVITLWGSEEDAAASAKAAEDDAIHTAFMSFVDPESIEVKHFFSREG